MKRRPRTKTAAEVARVENLSRNNFTKQHNQLERSVQALAARVYGITLYKTDAGAISVKCPCGRSAIRRPKIKSGLPDLIGCVPVTGRFLGVEIKTGAGVLRPSQKDVGNALVKDGAQVVVIRSMDEAEELFRALVTPHAGRMKDEQPAVLDAIKSALEGRDGNHDARKEPT